MIFIPLLVRWYENRCDVEGFITIKFTKKCMTIRQNYLIQNQKPWFCETNAKTTRIFLEGLSKQQKPKIPMDWFACRKQSPCQSNNRNWPRDIFRASKFANMVVHSDLNIVECVRDMQSLFLKVEHYIFCGNYGLRGIEACIRHKSYGLLSTNG